MNGACNSGVTRRVVALHFFTVVAAERMSQRGVATPPLAAPYHHGAMAFPSRYKGGRMLEEAERRSGRLRAKV